jgi:hypothetical protein
MMLGALFAASMLKSRPAQGHTMVVWGDPDGWGCIGMCGGGGYFELPEWSDGGNIGDGSVGGGVSAEPGSADWPLDVPGYAKGGCAPPSTRAARASAVVRNYVLHSSPDITTCDFDLRKGEYFFVRYEDGHLGSSFQWTGHCDLSDPTPDFLTEVSSQCSTH